MVCPKVLTFLTIYLWSKVVCFVLFIRLISPKPWCYLLVLVLFASYVGVVALLVFVVLLFLHRYYCSSHVVLLLFLCGATILPTCVTTLPTWCCYFFHVGVTHFSCVATTTFCYTSVPCSFHVDVVILIPKRRDTQNASRSPVWPP
jgi:hypothetical protein